MRVENFFRCLISFLLMFISHCRRDDKDTRRVLVIGSTGTGKSTLINSLVGYRARDTSSGAKGCTASYSSTHMMHEGYRYDFIDTVGLNEPDGGTVSQSDALGKFLMFLKNNAKGFNLIIFCMREGRLTVQDKITYQLMIKDLYSQVKTEPPPVMLFVGGLFVEHAHPQDWCAKNRNIFVNQGYVEATADLDGIHCITFPAKAQNPKLEAVYMETRSESKNRAWDLISKNCLSRPRPFYNTVPEMASLGVYLWNLLVKYAAKIPVGKNRTLKDAMGWTFIVSKDIMDILVKMGFTKENLASAALSYYGLA